MKKPNVKVIARKTAKKVSEKSPMILTGLGVAGLFTTTGMGVQATYKSLQILEDAIYDPAEPRPKVTWDDIRAEFTYVDILKQVWKCYIPTVAMASVSTACIIGSNTINSRRRAALASMYSLSELALKEYQAKVVETFGEKKAQKVKDDIHKDKIKANPSDEGTVIFTGKGETLCYESLSGRYFRSDIEKIRKAENDLNAVMLKDDFISLNDVYYELGLANTKMGDEVGWTAEDNLFSFEFSSQLSEDGTPCLVVDYFAMPRPEYMDYWRIK